MPISPRASFTSSNLNGLIIASIFFIRFPYGSLYLELLGGPKVNRKSRRAQASKSAAKPTDNYGGQGGAREIILSTRRNFLPTLDGIFSCTILTTHGPKCCCNLPSKIILRRAQSREKRRATSAIDDQLNVFGQVLGDFSDHIAFQ